MNGFFKGILSVVVITTLFSCSKNGKPTSVAPGSTSTIPYTPNDSILKVIDHIERLDTIHWLSLKEAELYNSIRPKKMVIDMYTSWCGWCKVMDKKTFTNPKVIDFVNQNYYAIKFDAESKKAVTFNNKAYTYSGKNNKFAVDMMEGYMSFPTTVYLDSDKSMISHVPGYWKADDFLLILTFFHEDHYKTMRFEEYKSSVK